MADTNDKKNSFKKTYDYTTTTDNISSNKGGHSHTDQLTSQGGWATSLSPMPSGGGTKLQFSRAGLGGQPMLSSFDHVSPKVFAKTPHIWPV